MDLATLGIKISPSQAKDGAQEVVVSLKSMGDAAEKAQKRIDSSLSSLKGFDAIGKQLSGLKTLLISIGAVAGFKKLVDENAEFEKSMSRVKGVTKATTAELQAISKASREFAVQSGSIPAAEIAKSMAELAEAGFNSAQSIKAMPDILNLATASSLSLGDSVYTTAKTLKGFQLDVAETGRVVDILAKAASSGLTDIKGMGDGLNKVGPAAARANVSLEQSAAAIALLTNNGIGGIQAGKQLRQGIESLVTPSKAAKDALEAIGLTTEDVNPNMHSFTEILEKLSPIANDAGKASKIFGDQGYVSMSLLVSQLPQLKELNKTLGESGGTAKQLASDFKDNLSGDIGKFVASLKEIVLQTGTDSGLVGGLRKVVQTATDVVKAFAGIGNEADNVNPKIAALKQVFSDAADGFKILKQIYSQGDLGKLLGLSLELAFFKAIDVLARGLSGAIKSIIPIIKGIFSLDLWEGLILGFTGVSMKVSAIFLDVASKFISYIEAGFITAAKMLYNQVKDLLGFGGESQTVIFDQEYNKRLIANAAMAKRSNQDADKALTESGQKLMAWGEKNGRAVADAFLQGWESGGIQSKLWDDAQKDFSELVTKAWEDIPKPSQALSLTPTAPAAKAVADSASVPTVKLSELALEMETDQKIINKYNESLNALNELYVSGLVGIDEYISRSDKLANETYQNLSNKANATKDILDTVSPDLMLKETSENLNVINAQIQSINSDPFLLMSDRNRELNGLYDQQIASLKMVIELNNQKMETMSDPAALIELESQNRELELQVKNLQDIKQLNTTAGQFKSEIIGWTNQLGTVGGNAAKVITGSLDSAINTASSSLQQAMMHTKSWGDAFDEIGTQILATLQQMIIKMTLAAGIQAALGGIGGGGGSLLGGGGGLIGSLFHKGGISGQGQPDSRNIFAFTPKFHSGGLASDERLSITKEDEGIFTPDQMRALGGNKKQEAQQKPVNVEILNVTDPSMIDAMIAANPDIIINALSRRPRAAKMAMGLR